MYKSVAVAVLLVCTGVFLYPQEDRRLEQEKSVAGLNRQLTESLHPLDYAPFVSGTKVTILNEPVDINFTGELPRLNGATAAFPVYAAFVQALYPPDTYYARRKILDCSTTRYAYEALVEGRADIIFCYAPSKEQKQMAAEKGLQYHMVPICKDAFVFFVNKNNPVQDMSLRQIRDIYTGRISNWKDLGGNEEEIMAYQRNNGSGSQTAFLALMGDETAIREPPSEQVIEGMGMMIQRVADYRNGMGALGYSFRFFTQEMAGNNLIRLMSIDGTSPTVANIRNGQYPFTETLYAITTGNESPDVQKFLDWVVSDQGQRLIEKVGYVPVR
ncbi:MAG: substrate-binding domain-containing protein [Spirochaetaceae bacterium]|jgi:phosphate transport system substrate-binding protein|nr:substrate-binding domain-containing protein [Spirochaetaceae bacterium]